MNDLDVFRDSEELKHRRLRMFMRMAIRFQSNRRMREYSLENAEYQVPGLQLSFRGSQVVMRLNEREEVYS